MVKNWYSFNSQEHHWCSINCVRIVLEQKLTSFLVFCKSSKLIFYPLRINNNTTNWIEIFEKLLYTTIRHVYILNSLEPRWCFPNCLWLVMGQSRTLTLPNKPCVMVLDHMFQDHNLGATSHNPRFKKSRKNLRLGIFGIVSVWRDLAGTTIVHSFWTEVNESLRFPLLFSSQLRL